VILTRRHLFGLGGGLAASLLLPRSAVPAGASVEIAMRGSADGSRVGFDPLGVHVEPGQAIRWINRDPGNAHTATAYHPGVMDRPRRIPGGAEVWDSDYLLPGESFTVTLRTPGVYDYYCVPHEMAGMVGRIVVGNPAGTGWPGETDTDAGLPAVALEAFPAIDEIVRRRRVHPVQASLKAAGLSWG